VADRFERVLIANRGEIACRIMRACRSVGLETVAVCSEADRHALHVSLADRFELIGPAAARASYLRIDRILEAARRSGAQAIHPGYGFLSENASFAQAVVDAGLVWIGPSPRTIADMGDKSRARALAAHAGLPVLPGAPLEDGIGPSSLQSAAERIGFPLLIKATAGGGGMGIQHVRSASELSEALKRTQTLGARLFGDGGVYLERWVPRARHIEVQVVGDGEGGVIHLFERDCSVQRRFQKVIEETPAPALAEHTRAAVCAHAVRLAESSRYRGPGTVEFILDAETEDAYFLEMNTRIQVEHGITEMVTGVDLVALQLAIANGEGLGVRQAEVQSAGVAVECRLYAEDPKAGFRPSTGRLDTLRFPASSATLRIDSGLREGDAVTPYYDPLIAKVMTLGADRRAALRQMSEALLEVQIAGIKSNLQLLRQVATYPGFIDARLLHTGILAEAHAGC
jgi:3-methylcrotonyl-CoA carboxylase alpha subunit